MDDAPGAMRATGRTRRGVGRDRIWRYSRGSLGAALLMTTFMATDAALAADLTAGDLLTMGQVPGATTPSVLRIDPATGDREVVSGPTGSSGMVGSGPLIAYSSHSGLSVMYTRSGDIFISTVRAWYHVDPFSGDRTLVSGCSNPSPCNNADVGAGPVPVNNWGLTEVRPAPPGVAALAPWALPALVGLLAGLGIRRVAARTG
jgi:hypothetical protein